MHFFAQLRSARMSCSESPSSPHLRQPDTPATGRSKHLQGLSRGFLTFRIKLLSFASEFVLFLPGQLPHSEPDRAEMQGFRGGTSAVVMYTHRTSDSTPRLRVGNFASRIRHATTIHENIFAIEGSLMDRKGPGKAHLFVQRWISEAIVSFYIFSP